MARTDCFAASYPGLITDVEFSIPVRTERERGIRPELVRDLRRDA
jgi:hypothetical protein